MTATQLAPLPETQLASMRPLFHRVVFGVDFGSASLAAARWTAQFIAPGAEAIVSHVASVDVASVDDATVSDDDGDDQLSIRRLMPALSGGLGGFAATLDSKIVRTVVRMGSPSHWLTTIAGGAEASLLVLGRRGDANRKTVGEPNVIERVARRAACSVLVVPEGIASAPRSIVAAVDESAFAPRVLRTARRLARLHDLPLTVLHVLPPSSGGFDRGPRRMVDGQRPVWVSPGEEPGVVSTETTAWLDALAHSKDAIARERTELAVGDAPREIISTGLAEGSPLLVVGTRGADGAVPGSLGSVARELLTRAPVPVLAINGA